MAFPDKIYRFVCIPVSILFLYNNNIVAKKRMYAELSVFSNTLRDKTTGTQYLFFKILSIFGSFFLTCVKLYRTQSPGCVDRVRVST
ncbi:hypothetical protein CLU79DRAFT_524447 [Phycomyces nitens]|nr:hypothetical protein CLU79DRAFT_524447 [Phycomyces nitens]